MTSKYHCDLTLCVQNRRRYTHFCRQGKYFIDHPESIWRCHSTELSHSGEKQPEICVPML